MADDRSDDENVNEDTRTPLIVDIRPNFEAASGDLVRLDAEVVTTSPSVDIVARWTQTGRPQVTLGGRRHGECNVHRPVGYG